MNRTGIPAQRDW